MKLEEYPIRSFILAHSNLISLNLSVKKPDADRYKMIQTEKSMRLCFKPSESFL